MKFSTISEVLEAFRNGEMVIVVDDENRENEGDFIMPAETITPEKVNFMTKFGRGLMCVPITAERAEALDLEAMAQRNTALHETNFTVSVDARQNTTTGISAFDRYETINALIADETKPKDLARPGHIFPIIAVPGGVLQRAGHTEATVDLARLAGFKSAGVLCEIIDNDGTMARGKRLFEIAKEHHLKIMTIADLISYRRKMEKLIECTAKSDFPSKYGHFTLYHYQNVLTEESHLALVRGNITQDAETLVRVHSECLTGDVLGSWRCDCGDQLRKAMEMIGKSETGVLLYLRQEGRGIGLRHKIKAYEYQDQGLDTVEANEELGFLPDLREYGIGAQILRDLGVRRIRLLTNNLRKIVGIEGYGLEVIERVSIEIGANDTNRKYLETKRDKLGHLIMQEKKDE